MTNLTVERLKELLNYDPDTGVFTWRVRRGGNAKAGGKAGYCHPRGYWCIEINDKLYRAHRLAWLYTTGSWPEGEIDHANMDKSDNRWENIRDASRSQNNANTPLRTDNTSGFKGVHFCKRPRRWQAKVTVNRKQIFLGYYDTREEAHAVYAAAAKHYFGEFARCGDEG